VGAGREFVSFLALLQQPALTGQLPPAGSRPTWQPVDQLLIERVQAPGRRRWVLACTSPARHAS
jgi:hypothetical protein